MKTLLPTILLCALLLSPSIAADEIVRLEVRFRDLPKKWLECVGDSDLKRWTTEKGFSPFPAIVSPLGHPLSASITKKYPVAGADDEDPKVQCGISFALTLKSVDRKRFLVGKVVLTRVAEKDTNSGSVRLETQEVLIRSEAADGKAISVRLEDGARVLLAPTLLDAAGRRLNQIKAAEQAGTGQPATRSKAKPEGSGKHKSQSESKGRSR